MAEFSFEIEEKLLVLSENDKGWTKELNRVSFNGAPAKYDIRTWSPDHTKMGKGITLSNEEFQVLVDALQKLKQGQHGAGLIFCLKRINDKFEIENG